MVWPGETTGDEWKQGSDDNLSQFEEADSDAWKAEVPVSDLARNIRLPKPLCQTGKWYRFDPPRSAGAYRAQPKSDLVPTLLSLTPMSLTFEGGICLGHIGDCGWFPGEMVECEDPNADLYVFQGVPLEACHGEHFVFVVWPDADEGSQMRPT